MSHTLLHTLDCKVYNETGIDLVSDSALGMSKGVLGAEL